MTLTTIELLSQASTVGRARIADVMAAGVPTDEILRLARLGLVDVIPAAYPQPENLPTVASTFGPVQLEYVNLI